MKFSNIIILVMTGLFVLACGEATVDIDNSDYEAKIVVEGYLYPGQPVQDIKISRNIPLNTKISRADLILSDALVTITRLDNGGEYELQFDEDAQSYFDPGAELVIEHGKEYRLNVAVSYDDYDLSTHSTTSVPNAGFGIIDEQSSDSVKYFSRENPMGYLQKPVVAFNRAPLGDFYGFSIVSLEADTNSFIYPPDNPFLMSDYDKENVKEDFDDLIYSTDVLFNTPPEAGSMNFQIEWFHFLFYGNYRVVAYAGDLNMKNYFLTFGNVKEMDGNLHEPVFNFEGDGIGVFGSAIRDTMYLNIYK